MLSKIALMHFDYGKFSFDFRRKMGLGWGLEDDLAEVVH
jgi:hypothetical protein